MVRSQSLVAPCALLLALGLSALVSPALAQAPSPLAFSFASQPPITVGGSTIRFIQIMQQTNPLFNVNMAQVTLTPCAGEPWSS